MPNNHAILPKQDNVQLGFTLLELLVALFLGLLLVGFLIQSYVSTKQTYRITRGVGENQETTRFASHFINTDIRTSGDIGCVDSIRDMRNVNNYLLMSAPVLGWEYRGAALSTSGDKITLPNILPTNTTAFGSATDWQRSTPPATPTTPPPFPTIGLPTMIQGDVVVGSDVLVVNSVTPTSLVINATNSTTGVITLNSPHGFTNNQPVLIGDCFMSDIAINTSNDTGTTPTVTTISAGTSQNTNTSWSIAWAAGAKVSTIRSFAYYIGRSNGQPTLMRRELSNPNSVEQPLVEGVETLQFSYGVDADNDPTRTPNFYEPANRVANWAQVTAVKVAMLVKSDVNADAKNLSTDSATSYSLLAGLSAIHTSADNNLRFTVSNTVNPRNASSLRAPYVCAAGGSICDSFRSSGN